MNQDSAVFQKAKVSLSRDQVANRAQFFRSEKMRIERALCRMIGSDHCKDLFLALSVALLLSPLSPSPGSTCHGIRIQ